MSSIVDQIRVALNKRDGINEELMRPLAEAYAHETRRVNERLAAAADMLRKGLRSEAIQGVLAHPNALDAAVALDFAEIEEWFDILQFIGIAVPDSVRSDLVEQLNETIVEAQPMEALLKQHRRLALARAPLPWRLKVLRRIAQLDPINAFWSDDIADYEQVRKKQLPAAISKAIADKNTEDLLALQEEVSNSNWLSPPEQVHAQTISKAIEDFKSEECLKELQRLGPLLHDAFCEFDEPTARQYLAQWHAAEKSFRGALPESLLAQFKPTADWIAELDFEQAEREKRNAALSRLERTLDSNGSLHELEQAYHKARLFDAPIPEELARRYHLAIEAKSLSKKRVFQAVIVGLIAIAICIVGAFGWWQLEEEKSRRLVEAETQLRSLIDSADIVAARTFYEQLTKADPPTAQRSEILTLAGKLESLESEEENRKAEFEGHLARANADDPANINMSSLGKAEALAVSEPEKAKAFAVRARREQWESELATAQSEQVRATLLQQRKILDDVDQQPASYELINSLAGVLAKLEPLPVQFPRAANTLRDQVNSEVQRARSLRNAVTARMQRQTREEEAYASFLNSNSLAELARNMKRHATEFPGSNLASDFSIVAGEETLWTSMDRWNALMKNATAVLVARFSTDKLAEFDSASQVIELESHPAATTEVKVALNPIFTVAERRAVFKDVFLGLGDSIFSDLFTIKELEDDQQYRRFVYKSYVETHYDRLFNANANGEVAPQGVEVVDDSSGAIRNTTFNGVLASNSEPKATVDWLVGVGETSEAKFLLDWEGEFVRVVAELFKRPSLDRQLKEMILQHLLAGACQGSDLLRERLAGALVMLNERENIRATWFKKMPVNHAIDKTVESEIVSLLKSIYNERQVLSDNLNILKNAEIQWVGMLTRDSAGKISIHLKSKQTANGNLYVINESTESPSDSVWVGVGAVDGNRLSENRNVDLQLAGRPVFLFQNNLQP